MIWCARLSSGVMVLVCSSLKWCNGFGVLVSSGVMVLVCSSLKCVMVWCARLSSGVMVWCARLSSGVMVLVCSSLKWCNGFGVLVSQVV